MLSGAPVPAQPTKVAQATAPSSALFDVFGSPPPAPAPVKSANAPQNLLDLGGFGLSPAPVQPPPSVAAPIQSTNLFSVDLMGGGTPPTAKLEVMKPAPATSLISTDLFAATAPITLSSGPAADNSMNLKVAEDANIEIWLNLCKKEKDKPDTTAIVTSFTNKQPSTVTDIVLQVAAQKHLKLQMNPINSNQIPGNSKGKTQQVLATTTSR
jgi:hypothetical protein